MNKRLFLKLGLGLLISVSSLSFIACGEKNNSTKPIDSSKNIVEHKTEKTQEKTEENKHKKIEEKTQEKKQEKIQEDNQKNIQKNTEKNDLKNTKQESKEKHYYTLIKEAWQKQKDYIDSINDSKVKQSVQTTNSAAIAKSNELLLKYPEDSKDIERSLKKVLNGEDFK